MFRMAHIRFAILLLCAAASLGCRSGALAPGSRTIRPELAEAVRLAVSGDNQLGVDLLPLIAEENKNLVYSPYGIASILAQTWLGAAGVTAREHAILLGYEKGALQPHDARRAIRRSLVVGGTQGNYDLAVANEILVLWGGSIRRQYLAQLQQSYDSRPTIAKSPEDVEPMRVALNDRIAKVTRGLFPEVLSPSSIDVLTGIVLVNAIYFKGTWSKPFPEIYTRDLPFYPSNGDTILVPTMHERRSVLYAENDTAAVISLPYEGQDLVMHVILPAPGENPQYPRNLTKTSINMLLAQETETEVKVYLPRFKFRNRYNLKPVLQSLGFEAAFDRGLADFSLMADGRGLFIGKLIHEATVEVDEKGTVAAAVTLAKLEAAGYVGAPPEFPEFRADRPFLFVIQDRVTKAILFIGRVENPLAA